MHTISANEAKTHLSKILKDVEQGKTIFITRHGRKIALIIPFTETEEFVNRFEIAKDSLRKMRRGVTLGSNLTIKQLIDEERQ